MSTGRRLNHAPPARSTKVNNSAGERVRDGLHHNTGDSRVEETAEGKAEDRAQVVADAERGAQGEAGGIHGEAGGDRVTTIDLESSLRTLHAKRTELLNQVDAIDTALAALATVGIIVVNASDPQAEAADDVTRPVVPTRIKARRVLSDEHRQALLDGRRMARHRRAVDEGRARELLAPSAAPSEDAELPRLVKRAK
jgi:hypothetical protein